MKTTLAQAIEQGATIRKLVANPYREGSKAWTQFESYQNGRSVEATLTAVATLSDAIASAERFRWDVNHDTVALDFPIDLSAGKKATKAEPKAETVEPTPAKAKRSRKAKAEPAAEVAAEEPKAEPTPAKAKRVRKASPSKAKAEVEPTPAEPKAEEPKTKAKRSRSKASHSSLEPAFPAPTPAGA